MSARAIAAARSRNAIGLQQNDRPLSAYEETPETMKNRRRASVAVMPMIEAEYRERAGSCSSLKEREFSPDFGAIRVQVEDITTGPTDLVDEDQVDSRNTFFDPHEELSAETSTETIKSENMRRAEGKRVAEWAVPMEYACSPIAQELKQSEIDERPRPPIPVMYVNHQSRKKSGGSEQDSSGTYSDFISKKNVSMRKSVDLLEQIIRTRTIWFLPHIGRPEANHLLNRMETGNFIVRSCAQNNFMALSVRMPPTSNVEVEHFIIEDVGKLSGSNSARRRTLGSSQAVRMEGSSDEFNSIPQMIQYYCANEKLGVQLCLPTAIRTCTTTKQLQSVALMEQEFWTSEMALSRRPCRSVSRSSLGSYTSSNNNTMPRCYPNRDTEHASTWFMGNSEEDKSIYDDVASNGSKLDNRRTSSYYSVNEHGRKEKAKNNNNNGLLAPDMSLSSDGSVKSTSKKRRSTSRASANSSRFATVCVGDLSFERKPIGDDETDSGLSSHSPPSKHDRIEDANSSICRSERRSQSVRSHKSVKAAPVATSSHTIARSSRPRSFLRSLLSFGTSTKDSSSGRKNSLKENIDSTPRSTHCEYFTPWDRSLTQQTRNSRSAFDITTPPTRGFFTTPKKRNGLPTSSSIQNTADIFDDDNYTRGWKEAAFVAEMTAAKAKGSPGGGGRNQNNGGGDGMKTFKPPNYDEVTGASSRSRPLAMRRERSDLGTTFGIIKNNAQRLAYHNESSPGPANNGSRVPMTPPMNGNDPQMIKNCMEELRRKRLQSANEMLAPQDSYRHVGGAQSAHASPQIAMRRRNNGFPSPSSSLFNRAPFAGIDRHRGGEHRLSVPNLIAASDPMIPGCIDEKNGRLQQNETEQMEVINEGVVTPIMRRKGVVTKEDGEVAKRREALELLIDKRAKDSSSGTSLDQASLGRKNSGSGVGESELIWRRAKQHQQSKASASHRHSGNQWTAVNFELKNRQQRVAKVLPTPQARSQRMTVDSARRSSDYAQLCDFSSSEQHKSINSTHLDVHHSKIDDDAVSVAGTVFNEPWDSNVWENLLDLAHHGDETTKGHKVTEPIQEEDSDSDRTAGGESTCIMDSEDDDDDDEEDEEVRWPSDELKRRPLPSDRVTVKAWEQDNASVSTKFSTLDSRSKNMNGGGSTCGTVRRHQEGSFSLGRVPSRVSQIGISAAPSFGSIDDLPTTLPSMSPLLSGRASRAHLPARSPCNEDKIGRAVQEYVEQLAQVRQGDNACFGLTLRQFVACTKETKETDPSVVVRNVRQFINGMKNYLVKHGEGDLHRIIDQESSRLNSNQILNIDAVLEAVLHKLLLREVKPLLYHVMVKEHSKSGTLSNVTTNIGIVRKMDLAQLGFSNADMLVVPSQTTMDQVKLLMRKMQSHYSPLKKLENLMKAVSLVVGCQNRNKKLNEENTDPALLKGIPAADDLVRWLVYILARTSSVNIEVEAWYMWELLPQPILMQSDASYYLTALFSAVHVLKSEKALQRLSEKDRGDGMELARNACSSPLLSTATLTRGNSSNMSPVSTASCDAFVKIAVPDETVGCVRYATFPGVPMLTTSKLSRLIAHQQGITNPEEHGLYLIADGYESCLTSTDCPVMIHEQLKKENKPHLFAYKRHEAKIAWPRAAISTC